MKLATFSQKNPPSFRGGEHVKVTNPSSYIRTNGSISLDFVASLITDLTLLNTTSTVNLGELGAESSKKNHVYFFN
ncbi:MAG: hypothetical protein ACXADA_00010 [Candidatus Hodarchaeales archaeon]